MRPGWANYRVRRSVITIGIALATASFSWACASRRSPPNKTAPSPSPGQCNNPFLPVDPNLRLEYQSTFSGGLAPYSFTVTFSDISGSSFVRHEVSSDNRTLDSEWKCRPDGLIASDYGDLAAPQSRLKVNTVKSSGVAIPAASKWLKGMKWNYSYQITGEMIFGGAPTPIEVAGTIVVANEVIGPEPLTLPAGKFDAMKVFSRTVEHLSMKGGGVLPGDINFSTSSWYAKDVGLLKVQSDELKITTVLTSFSRQQPSPEPDQDDDSSSATLVWPESAFISRHIDDERHMQASRACAYLVIGIPGV